MTRSSTTSGATPAPYLLAVVVHLGAPDQLAGEAVERDDVGVVADAEHEVAMHCDPAIEADAHPASRGSMRRGRCPRRCRRGRARGAVGLYGVVSYGVARRTREIGIRQALGADGSRVVRLLVAGGLKLVVLGGALGLALAVVATRLLGGLLFEIDALDPLTFLGVPLVLGAVALFAAWLPARRASRVSPVVALRTD